MPTHLCHLREENGTVSEIVRPLDTSSKDTLTIQSGSADLVTDALLAALGMKCGSFASSDDELAACIAALNERPLRITVTRRRVIHVEGYIDR